MRRLVLIVLVTVLVTVAAPGVVSAQTWGQPRYSGPGALSVQPYGLSAPRTYGGHGYGRGGVPAYGHTSAYGDPRAYRPPVQYGAGHDRGGRYGYSARHSGDWTRWSSPPGRGYHDIHGYNDDRAPRGADHRRHASRDCFCGSGAYLHDD